MHRAFPGYSEALITTQTSICGNPERSRRRNRKNVREEARETGYEGGSPPANTD